MIIYVKDTLFYGRRNDLESQGTECLWTEIIIIKHKKILFGLFYSTPNSDVNYYTSVEDSISLAVDTGINYILAGNFNFNMPSSNSSHKIKAICQQFSLNQVIEEPIHNTERSLSLLDIILTNNNDHLVMSGVGDPFLQRYHCTTYGILRFVKPKWQSYVWQIWIYEPGDYNLLKQKASSTDWDGLRNTDINIYAKNITEKIIALSNDCILNQNVRICPADSPCITTAIKRHIKIRKGAYRKVKHSNIPGNWERFRYFKK